jgi:hypothetical protein
MRNSYNIFAEKPEMNRPLGRPKRKWEVNIRPDPREIGRECVDWIRLAYDRDQ